MPHPRLAKGSILAFLFCAWFVLVSMAGAQTRVVLTVTDENGLAVSSAQVMVSEPGFRDQEMQTDYAGRCTYSLEQNASYQLRIDKPGFYQVLKSGVDTRLAEVTIVMVHIPVIQQNVNVIASTVGIDPEQTALTSSMNTPEIVNIPYPNSRGLINILPFNPGVVQDASGQVHVAGSDSYTSLYLLDGFDIRSPISGLLAARISPDAVRTIDVETTRYPVEYGKATGGVVAFNTGMGDNKFRFNATDFFPSLQNVNGIRFDKIVPRFTFSGPIVRDKAWYFDGLQLEFDDIYVPQLPDGANTNHLLRGSNLIKAQVNLTPANILSGGFLFNDSHSPYDAISAQTPQQSTVKRDTVAWVPYIRDQHTFSNGMLLDTGFGFVRFRDSLEPHGDQPFVLTPELPQGSFFQNTVAHSHRAEGNAALYFPPRHWMGRHDLKAGIDLDRVDLDEEITQAPVSYLREDRTLLRLSTFPVTAPFSRHNVETGAYLQDRWQLRPGLLVEPGLRFDWDEIIRRPLFSPRLAAAYAPDSRTKFTAGVGLYYEHTQLEYLTRSLAGIRYDTYYATDGVTPVSGPLETVFQENDDSLHQIHALNWSLGVERELPKSIYAGAHFIQKRINDGFVYANQNGPDALYGTYLLTNNRNDHYNSIEFDARRTFESGHTIFASYTRSSGNTNSGIDYVPTISQLGQQHSAPLACNSPNRLISWGWLPFAVPKFKKSWDFVYTVQWQSGFPFTAINANHQVVGAPGSYRYPDFVSISPGLEWRFHFRGAYFGLRGMIENITNNTDASVVNNNVDSPSFGTFSGVQSRSITARIRLIGTK